MQAKRDKFRRDLNFFFLLRPVISRDALKDIIIRLKKKFIIDFDFPLLS